MKKLLYAVCAVAFLGGMVAGCSDKAKADAPDFGEYLGQTATEVQVVRFYDGGNVCYVTTRYRGMVSPPAISCVRQ